MRSSHKGYGYGLKRFWPSSIEHEMLAVVEGICCILERHKVVTTQFQECFNQGCGGVITSNDQKSYQFTL
jgi:hypothetical protein